MTHVTFSTGHMPVLPPALAAHLRGLGCGLRLLRLARYLGLWLAFCALLLGLSVLILSCLASPPPLVVYLPGALAVLGGGLLATALLAPWVTPTRPRTLAQLVEARCPDLQDRLLAVVAPAMGVTSPALHSALARQVAERLRDEPPLRFVDWRTLRPVALLALTSILVAALIIIACPQGLARLLHSPDLPAHPAPRRPDRSNPAPLPARVGLYDLTVEVVPPAYCGLPASRVDRDFAALRVVRGSQVIVNARLSPGASATLQVGSPEVPLLDLRPTGGRVSHRFRVFRDTRWLLRARLGDQQASAGPYRITVIPDRSPRVRITRPGRDMQLGPTRQLPLAMEAVDDFGLSAVILQYRRGTERAWRALNLDHGGQKTFSQSFQWDLSPMGLRPGEVVQYRALARDNDTVSGPKQALSRVFTVRVPPAPRPAPPTPRDVKQAQEREADAVEQFKAEAELLDQQLQELVEQARAAEASGGGVELPRAVLQETQQRLAQRAQELRQAMAAAEKALTDNPLITDDLLQKVQQLHKLMAQLMNQDLQRVMQKLQDALRQRTPREMRMSLEQARQAQRELMDKLDRTLALLQRAKLEASLEALRRFVQQLADRQQALKQRTEQLGDGLSPEADIFQQRQLAEQTAPVAEQIRQVAQEVATVNPQAAADLRTLAGALEQRDPAGQMRRAAGAMQRGKSVQAAASQGQALAALRAAAAGLSTAAADLTAAERGALTSAARQLARNALALSRSQEGVLNQTRELLRRVMPDPIGQKNRLESVRRGQEAVRRGTEGLASHIQALARQTAAADPALAQRAAELAAEMAQATHEVQGAEISRAFQRQTEALRGLNALAQDLMDLSEQLNRTSAQTALQEYLRRLEALAQRQQALNQQTGADEAGFQGEPSAGDRSVRMPRPGADELAQMALEQALIRQALEKLLSESGASKLAEQLGGVPQQMEKIEDDLKARQLAAQTLNRQRDVLHKMLDAQRSLYSKDKQSPERKAEAPRPYQPPRSPPVLRPDQTRVPQSPRRPSSPAFWDLPLDFEQVTRAYLGKIHK